MRLHGENQVQKKKKFNQLWQGTQQLKETMVIQNEKLDKLTNITQNLENKLNGIQTKMVEYENKLTQLEEKKAKNYAMTWFRKQTACLVFQLDRQEQYIRENILIYGVEENKEDNDDGEKVLFKISDELEIDLKDNKIQRVHRLGQKEETMRFCAQSLQDLCHTKRNEFLANKRELKNVEGREHVFICEDLTPLRYKLLKYMQKSCSVTFTSCYTRNDYIEAKLKTSGKWVTVTSPDDLFKHGIDVDYKQMDCGEILNN